MGRRQNGGPLRIVVVAPRGMSFGPAAATSIDLCIRDFVRFSRFERTTTVIASHVEEPFTDVNLELLDPTAQSTSDRARMIARLIQSIRPELVVVHQHLPTAVKLRRLVPDCPVLLHVHNFQKEPSGFFGSYFKERHYKLLAGMICVSEAVRTHFVEHWGRTKIPAFTAHNGIDTIQWNASASDKSNLITLFRSGCSRERRSGGSRSGCKSAARLSQLAGIVPSQRSWPAR